MQDRQQIYVGGRFVAADSGEHIAVENPATEEVIGHVPAGNAADVDAAVAAARAAFEDWSRTDPDERAKYLERLGEAMKARADEIARTIALEMGAPLKLATTVQCGLPLAVLDYYPKLLRETSFEEEIANSLVVREPVGVVGAITPWNYPLHQVVAKVAPALAAGCTVVLKPSEIAPLCAFLLSDAVNEVGLPAGVFNLVSGTGTQVGEPLAAHPDVDMISFTGSTRAGRRVSEVAAATVKRVALELGGKSANVLLADADLEKAVKVGVANAFLNSGQTCTAWTRMIVDRTRYEQAVAIAAEATARYSLGDPFDESTRLGPLVSAVQRERVLGYVRRGVEEGARLVVGATDAPPIPPRGYFVAPTVFADVTSSMTIAQEEIFGPVLCLLSYDDEADALRIANDSRYGLAGAVWSADESRAIAFARRMRTGQVDINGGRFNPLAPFGGYKQSGHGRELGRYGLQEFCEVKSLQR